MTATTAGTSAEPHKHLAVLDGWRAISILGVMGCHLLPLGPGILELNLPAGMFGMSLFFTLSGFLITSALYREPQVVPFLIRRFFRILPAAFLYIVVALWLLGKSAPYFRSHLLFTMNYETDYITQLTPHLWSLCVEMQFYVFVAALVLCLGRWGLFLLPLLAPVVTYLRVEHHAYISTFTHLRVDEILAGAALALVFQLDQLRPVRKFLAWVPWWVWLPLAFASAHRRGADLNYLRPYLTAALVGHTLFAPAAINGWLSSRPLRYIAQISYALYLVHFLTAWRWFGVAHNAPTFFFKRALTFLLAFGIAHLSTFYYERWWSTQGKSLVAAWQRWIERRRLPVAQR